MQFIQGWHLVVEHVELRNLTIRTQEPLIFHSHWDPSGTPSCEVQRYKHTVSIGFIKNPKAVRICHVSRLRCPHALGIFELNCTPLKIIGSGNKPAYSSSYSSSSSQSLESFGPAILEEFHSEPTLQAMVRYPPIHSSEFHLTIKLQSASISSYGCFQGSENFSGLRNWNGKFLILRILFFGVEPRAVQNPKSVQYSPSLLILSANSPFPLLDSVKTNLQMVAILKNNFVGQGLKESNWNCYLGSS